jgi:hypothetical protein
MIWRFRRLAAVMLAALLCVGLTAGARAGNKELREQLEFAEKMAKRGNWREARYRWQKAARLDPDNPFIVNNLAVAEEALGSSDEARDLYAEAIALTQGNAHISENRRRQESFLRSIEKDDGDEERDGSPAATSYDLTAGASSKKKKKEPKTTTVPIHLPVPPRMDLTGLNTLLVVSFLTVETEMLDTNREIVRFLRSEFRRRTSLDVLDVTPAPAIPEQTLEDLAANTDFWKYLGRQHDTDLIVSGQVTFESRDASGFRDVDVVSNTTGHKVRQTRFVEQEEFTYRVDVLFIDGKSGEIRYRDTITRKMVFQGLSNDPLGAFFGLSESLASDVLSVLSYRVREEERVIFRD